MKKYAVFLVIFLAALFLVKVDAKADSDYQYGYYEVGAYGGTKNFTWHLTEDCILWHGKTGLPRWGLFGRIYQNNNDGITNDFVVLGSDYRFYYDDVVTMRIGLGTQVAKIKDNGKISRHGLHIGPFLSFGVKTSNVEGELSTHIASPIWENRENGSTWSNKYPESYTYSYIGYAPDLPIHFMMGAYASHLTVNNASVVGPFIRFDVTDHWTLEGNGNFLTGRNGESDIGLNLSYRR